MKLIAGKYKQTELGLIPCDWEVKTIDDLVNEGLIEKPLDGNHGNIHPKSDDFVESGIPFIMANNVSNGFIDIENCHFIKKEQADKLQKGFSFLGDVLFTHKGTVGNVAVVEKINCEYLMLTPQVTYYRVKNYNAISNLYIEQYFLSPTFQKFIKSISGGGTRAYIGITAQRGLPFILPTIEEQTAIATALSDADALISSLEKLIAKKRNIKQGVMQKLLQPKEGWEVKKLGQIAEICTGKKNNQDKIENGQYPFFVRSQSVERINSYSFDGEAILIPGEGNIGKIFHYVNGKFDFHQRVYKVSDFKQGYFGKYIYRYISEFFGRHAMENSVKATVDSLRLPTFQVFEIPFPQTFEEQVEIAIILSEMDAEISALETKLEKYKKIKLGMMQNLLTGKIRLV